VKKYREILADGSYQIKSSELADKIVQKVKENKNMILL
jgi:anti-sigma28 factor (negative regulator of flagellin synthesis)